MNIVKLETEEQAKSLCVGDLILVKWDDYTIRHSCRTKKKLQAYNIEQVKPLDHEIICQIKNNHFFNWELYLGINGERKRSCALEVYVVTEPAHD